MCFASTPILIAYDDVVKFDDLLDVSGLDIVDIDEFLGIDTVPENE